MDKKELAAKSRELKKRFKHARDGVSILLAVFLSFFLPALVTGLYQSYLVGWSQRISRSHSSQHVILFSLIAVVPAILAALHYVSPLFERQWKRHYRRAWSWLNFTKAGALVRGEGLSERIAGIRNSGRLRPGPVPPEPQSGAERVKLACDHRWALIEMARGGESAGDPHREQSLKHALRLSGFYRRLEAAAVELMYTTPQKIDRNSSRPGQGWVLVALTAPLWFPLFPPYLRRIAWELALTDILRGKPSLPVDGVGPPPGLE